MPTRRSSSRRSSSRAIPPADPTPTPTRVSSPVWWPTPARTATWPTRPPSRAPTSTTGPTRTTSATPRWPTTGTRPCGRWWAAVSGRPSGTRTRSRPPPSARFTTDWAAGASVRTARSTGSRRRDDAPGRSRPGASSCRCAGSLRSGLQDDLDAAVLLLLEDVVAVRRLFERHPVRHQVVHAQRVVVAGGQREDVAHPALHVCLAHPHRDPLVEQVHHRDRVGLAAV